MTSTLESLLQGGGKSAKFATLGDTTFGKVVKTEVRERVAPDTMKVQTWEDGRPQEQICVTVATSMRDPEDAHDDGHRTIYIKTWGDQLKELKRCIKEAGAKTVDIGGDFGARWVGEGQRPKPHMSLPKTMQYFYKAPDQLADVFGGQQQAAPAQPAATASPFAGQPAQPAAPAAQPAIPAQAGPAPSPWSDNAPPF